MAGSEQAEAVERLVEAKARPLIARGEANLETSPGLDETHFAFAPVHSRACPVWVMLDAGGGIVYLGFGRFGMQCEVVIGKDLPGALEFVEQCIDAVVAGRYRERGCVEGERTKCYGKLGLADRTITLAYNTFFGRRCRSGWQHVEYEPYSGSGSG